MSELDIRRLLTEPVYIDLHQVRMTFLRNPKANYPILTWDGTDTRLSNMPTEWSASQFLTFSFKFIDNAVRAHRTYARFAVLHPADFGLTPAAAVINPGQVFASRSFSDQDDRYPEWFGGHVAWFAPDADPATPGTLYLVPVERETLTAAGQENETECSWQVRQIGIDTLNHTCYREFRWDDRDAMTETVETMLSGGGDAVSAIRALSNPAIIEQWNREAAFWDKYASVYARAQPRTSRITRKSALRAVRFFPGVVGVSTLLSLGGLVNRVTLDSYPTRNIAALLDLSKVHRFSDDGYVDRFSNEHLPDGNHLVRIRRTNNSHPLAWKVFLVTDPALFRDAVPLFNSSITGYGPHNIHNRQYPPNTEVQGLSDNGWAPIGEPGPLRYPG